MLRILISFAKSRQRIEQHNVTCVVRFGHIWSAACIQLLTPSVAGDLSSWNKPGDRCYDFTDMVLIQPEILGKAFQLNILPATVQSDGLLQHSVVSPYQSPGTSIQVLLPDQFDRGNTTRVLYVLPVELFGGSQCGDPLAEIRKSNLHNEHHLVCVKPTFSHAPWYADHPSNLEIRQESHFLKVVIPFIDEHYCSSGDSTERLLLGFSKSGWGAFSLLMRHPHRFRRASAFDAPLAWQSPNRYGMGEIFETQANFDEYCISELLKPSAEKLGGKERLGLYGFSEFRGHHQFLHYRLLHFGIAHDYADGPRRAHRWDSGWVPEAVSFLLREPAT